MKNQEKMSLCLPQQIHRITHICYYTMVVSLSSVHCKNITHSHVRLTLPPLPWIPSTGALNTLLTVSIALLQLSPWPFISSISLNNLHQHTDVTRIHPLTNVLLVSNPPLAIVPYFSPPLLSTNHLKRKCLSTPTSSHHIITLIHFVQVHMKSFPLF